jgi:hypothetical protein
VLSIPPSQLIDAAAVLAGHRVKLANAVRVLRSAKSQPDQSITAEGAAASGSAGYYHGIKAGLDTIKGFARVYRYWVRMHGNRLAGRPFSSLNARRSRCLTTFSQNRSASKVCR